MKSQLKIAFFLITGNLTMVLLFGASLYYFLSNYSYTDFYKRLETRANITARYHFEPDSSSSKRMKRLREEHLERLTNETVYILNIDSLPQYSSKNHTLPEQFITGIIREGKGSLQQNNTFYWGIKYTAHQKNHLVIISAENYYATHHLAWIRNVILIALLFIIVITISLSVYFSRHIFDPIKQIIENVNNISTHNIHQRLEETDRDKEINQLILTFNNLLNRVETALETQKNFISNASHEFGTPLTAIIGEADVTLRKERSIPEYKETLNSILTQAERLNEISQSLLMLAQTGYRENRLNFEILRADELLWQIKDIMTRLIPENNIQIDFSLMPENPYKLKIKCNKQLLTLAISNILNNACKYSGNKLVTISIASNNEEVILIFRDMGIGIPEKELQFIYDPFFRASNTQRFGGYGIGLPLARNIVKIHNGSLQITSTLNKGTTVQIKIPLANL